MSLMDKLKFWKNAAPAVPAQDTSAPDDKPDDGAVTMNFSVMLNNRGGKVVVMKFNRNVNNLIFNPIDARNVAMHLLKSADDASPIIKPGPRGLKGIG